MGLFTITRDNGKSSSEVLCDLVAAAQPGALLSYDRLREALSVGASREYERRDVQLAVSRAERKLAVKHCRALVNVTNRGYRVAKAGEHQMLAGRKRDRSAKLLKRGLTLLQHVNWDEMTENERTAHEGHMLIMGALHQTMQGIDVRLQRVEQAIAASRSSSD